MNYFSISSSSPVEEKLALDSSSSLEIAIDTLLDDKPARAHQTVLLISSPKLNLDITFPFSVRTSGKAKLVLPHKKIPEVFSSKHLAGPLTLQILAASFGDDENKVDPEPLRYTISTDFSILPAPVSEKKGAIERPKTAQEVLDEEKKKYLSPKFEKLPEIHHSFRPKERTVGIVLVMCLIASLFVFMITLINFWTLFAQVNLNNLSAAFTNAPVAHSLFLLDIVAIEYSFYKYYKDTSVFDTLKSLAILVPVGVYFGSRALGEIRGRRLAESK